MSEQRRQELCKEFGLNPDDSRTTEVEYSMFERLSYLTKVTDRILYLLSRETMQK